ncbi:MAG: hypothetical protein HQ455_04845, partial [Burkholderiales bacterium]|nr:hypothetical protein [Burkholderiales bacterium]
MAANNDDWIQFPPRPGAPAPKIQNDLPKPAPRSTTNTPATDDNWIKFPALAPPKLPEAASAKEPVAPAPAVAQEPATPAPSPAAAAPPEQAAPSPEFVFKAFKFEGNKVYSNQRLQQLLTTAVPQVQDVVDLQKAADSVAQLYQKDGVLARVDLLPQDLTEGIVVISITEGRFAGAKLETPNSPKLPADYLVK